MCSFEINMHGIELRGFQRSVWWTSTVVLSLLLSPCLCEDLGSDLLVMSDRPTSCTYDTVYRMYGVHCGGLKLSAVPRNLKTSIEILDVSENKIRELTEDTFTSYTNIKYLYLEDNSIYMVEENALTPLAYLETLDLSQNALVTIPNSILHLQSLRKLLLKGNPLIHWNGELSALEKPIKAPLEVLDISDCKLKQLPDLGILPVLKDYNVSDNPLVSLAPDTFAKTCKLKLVDLSRSLNKIELCSRKPTIDFLMENNVFFMLGDSSKHESYDIAQCPVFPQDDSINATQHQCLSVKMASPVYRTSGRTWVTVAGGLGGFVVGFMLLLYIMHRRNVAQTTRTRKNTTQNKNKDEALLDRE